MAYDIHVSYGEPSVYVYAKLRHATLNLVLSQPEARALHATLSKTIEALDNGEPSSAAQESQV